MNELETTVDILPDSTLLDPALLRRIVDEVATELAHRSRAASWAERERAADGRGSDAERSLGH